MALASQSTRPQAVRNASTFQSPRQKRQKNYVIWTVVALLLAGGGAWAIWGRGSGQKNSPNNGPGPGNPNAALLNDSETKKPAATPAAPTSTTTPTNVADSSKPKAPVELEMGKPDGQPVGTQQPIDDPLAKPTPAPGGTPAGVSPGSGTAPPPAPTIVPPAPAPAPVDDVPAEASRLIDQAKQAMGQNKLIEARTALLGALNNDRLKESERVGLRSWISELNETIIFSPTIVAGDAFTESYKVVSGDVLERIARNKGLAVDWRLLARVNRMKDPGKLRLGQTLKLVKGPFHAVVHKSQFRVDIYAGTPLPPGTSGSPRPDGSEHGWTYIRSFNVGLGSDDGTPVGTFVVKKNSKLINPPWVNPKTGERFGADDPKNPIGEHWLGIVGVDDASKSKVGFGLHGTIDPGSIGKQMSMGCVRIMPEDIAVVWEMLAEEVSTVRIVP
ncbi:MAG: L,D-transpeptidase family protein [Phycisphaerales bacterium]